MDLGPTFWRGDPSYDQRDNPDEIDRERERQAATGARLDPECARNGCTADQPADTTIRPAGAR